MVDQLIDNHKNLLRKNSLILLYFSISKIYPGQMHYHCVQNDEYTQPYSILSYRHRFCSINYSVIHLISEGNLELC